MPVEVFGSVAPVQVTGSGGRGTGPQPCGLLSIGQAFIGKRNISNISGDDPCRVIVRILGLDFERGYLCGTMETLNVHTPDITVVTFWKGEIIDTKNYTFYSKPDFEDLVDVSRYVDMLNWSKFTSLDPFMDLVETDGGISLDLSNHEYIYMRWEEGNFMNAKFDCGLTIDGVYYICFSCIDGSIKGFYDDLNSMPFQKLHLKIMNQGRSCFSSSSYEFQ